MCAFQNYDYEITLTISQKRSGAFIYLIISSPVHGHNFLLITKLFKYLYAMMM